TSRYLSRSLGELLSGRRVGFEDAHLTVAAHRVLAEGGVELVPTSGTVEALRAVKEDEEIAAMRAAAQRSDEMFSALVQERFVGRSERGLAWWIERTFREAGAERVAFPAIVAAGVDGASPHADPGDLVLGAEMLVTGER